jgi:hypothetical protein
LRFEGAGARDVYNITAPFACGGARVIVARVEAREVEHADAMFFQEHPDGIWRPHPGAVVLHGLQDPCVARIAGEWVVGGVRFPARLADGGTAWRMEFYRGRALASLRHFLDGPDRMKDIRLVELPGGRVGVLTRPQGAKGGRGKIGFYIADSLAALNAPDIAAAPLLEDQCIDTEWVGANEAHLLPGGLLGVLGHIACFDAREHRHYYPMTFHLDPATRRTTPVRIIACRDDFPAGDSKRPDLADVVFSGGLLRRADGTARLYSGLSDMEAGWLDLPDPFECKMKMENEKCPDRPAPFAGGRPARG